MANKGENVWVGVKLGGIPGVGDVLARTDLKGLSEASGVSYNTAKSKAVGCDKFDLKAADGSLWGFYRVVLGRVEGRGGKRGGDGLAKYFLG
jgi:hypothetical protein